MDKSIIKESNYEIYENLDINLLELGKLMEENKDLPVIPMVHDSIANTNCDYSEQYIGKWSKVYLAHYALQLELGFIVKEWVLDENEHYFENYFEMLQDYYGKKLDYNETKKKVLIAMDKIPWQKAIFIEVDPIDDEPQGYYTQIFRKDITELTKLYKKLDIIHDLYKKNPPKAIEAQSSIEEYIHSFNLLIQENPNLPCYPIIDNDVIRNTSECSRWKSAWGPCIVGHILVHETEGLIIKEYAREDLLYELFFGEDMFTQSAGDEYEDGFSTNIDDNVQYENRVNKIESLPWKKAILVKLENIYDSDFFNLKVFEI